MSEVLKAKHGPFAWTKYTSMLYPVQYRLTMFLITGIYCTQNEGLNVKYDKTFSNKASRLDHLLNAPFYQTIGVPLMLCYLFVLDILYIA